MKKTTLRRMLVLCLCLTLVSVSLIGGTLAKYVTEETAYGTFTVAKWDVDFKVNDTDAANFTETARFNLSTVKTTNANVATDKIAPGDSGSFNVKVSGTNTEVAYEYTVDISALSDANVPVKFYSDAAMQNEWDNNAEATKVALADANKEQTVTVYWQWVTNTDALDTAEGVDPATATFTITINATQTVA